MPSEKSNIQRRKSDIHWWSWSSSWSTSSVWAPYFSHMVYLTTAMLMTLSSSFLFLRMTRLYQLVVQLRLKKNISSWFCPILKSSSVLQVFPVIPLSPVHQNFIVSDHPHNVNKDFWALTFKERHAELLCITSGRSDLMIYANQRLVLVLVISWLDDCY